MGKYIHGFETISDFTEAYEGPAYLEPWVSYTLENTSVEYNADENSLIHWRAQYLTFDIISDGTICWFKTSGAESKTIYYSLNEEDYVEITAQDISGVTINVSAGDTLRFKGYNDCYASSTLSYGSASTTGCRFGGTAKFNIKGNIHSLLSGDDFRNITTLTAESTFAALFRGSNVVSAKELILPATTLCSYCYRALFSTCANLIEAPKVLPSITVNAGRCYEDMFYNCKKLKVAPKILANTCNTTAFRNMFAGCKDLKYINCQLLTPSALDNWTNNVYPVGLFVQNQNVTGSWSRGTSQVPTHWTVGTFCSDRKAIVVDEEQCVVPLEIISENAWEITSLPTWIHIDQLNGSDIYTKINITIDQAYDIRNGTITFKSNDIIYNLPIKQSSTQEFSIICTGNTGAIYCKGVSSMIGKTIEYSLNDGEWTSVTASSGNGTLMANVSTGDIIRVRSDNPRMATDQSNYITFYSTTVTELSGNILSLINSTDFTSVTSLSHSYNFCKLFTGTMVVYADNLKLKLVSDYCYSYAFSGCTTLRKPPKFTASTLARGCYNYMFNNCTSLTTAPDLPATTLAPYCYNYMFYYCTQLETPPSILPAATLKEYCYTSMFSKCTNLKKTPTFSFIATDKNSCSSMFNECTNLTEAADLPATAVGANSYGEMFRMCTSLITAPKILATSFTGTSSCTLMFSGCTSLINPPILSATTLNTSCYANMFTNCTSLTTAPDLPATTLAPYCYQYMFNGCTSLTTAPDLPATTLGIGCYSSMFNGCTSLTTAPDLPATTLESSCYQRMFNGCTSLITAPTLSATTIPGTAYSYMFYGCTSLTRAPQILAENLTGSATSNTYGHFAYMFKDCTNLITAPQLFITDLVEYCYSNMFENCTSLISAPVLLATTLKQGCYEQMFKNCSSLNSIKAMFTTTPDDTYTSSWVDGVSETGTFIKNASAEWNVVGTNGIPEGWTVETASN